MLTGRGATVLHGPVMHTSLLHDVDATVLASIQLIEQGADLVVLTTGIGTRSWFGAAESAGIDGPLRDACDRATVFARGPKARSAAIGCGLSVDWHAPGETGEEVVEHLRELGVAGKRVAVQRDGGAPLMADALVALGAEVIDVPVYRWHMPSDTGPANRLLDAVLDDRVDAVTFTCSYAVTAAFRLAPDAAALTAALGRRAWAVAVGPVTASTLRDMGVTRVVEPQRARLGSMIQALMGAMAGTAVQLRHGGHDAVLQGNAIVSDGSVNQLTIGERRLLDLLVRRSPAVVAKTDLVPDGADPHAVEAAIGRLRTKLGPIGPGIRVVPRRGYVADFDVEPVLAPVP